MMNILERTTVVVAVVLLLRSQIATLRSIFLSISSQTIYSNLTKISLTQISLTQISLTRSHSDLTYHDDDLKNIIIIFN